jgi:hypothetical protein
MRDLTMNELDTELAEQLPARELMGGCCSRSGSTNNGNGIYILSNNQFNVLAFGNTNGNGNYS